MDLTDPRNSVNLDSLTDEQVLERCRRARRLEEGSELGRSRAARAIIVDTRDYATLGERPDEDERKLVAFFDIFHPNHPRAPKSAVEARELMGDGGDR